MLHGPIYALDLEPTRTYTDCVIDRLVKAIANKPTEIIEGIICFLAIYVGLFALTPYYVSSTHSVMIIAITSDIALTAYAIWLLFWGSIGLYSLLEAGFPYRKNGRKWTSGALFLSLIWFTIMRLAVFGWQEVNWVPLFCLALIEGILYIRIGWEKNEKGEI